MPLVEREVEVTTVPGVCTIRSKYVTYADPSAVLAGDRVVSLTDPLRVPAPMREELLKEDLPEYDIARLAPVALDAPAEVVAAYDATLVTLTEERSVRVAARLAVKLDGGLVEPLAPADPVVLVKG